MITNLQEAVVNPTLTKQISPRIQMGIDMDKLIGTPHLLSRYCETRQGFMCVPIGEMTLQDDGRVTGYSHFNEGFWRPYKYGAVSEDKGFAFVNVHNRFIPTSVWQQTFSGMPVGYFCGDPELPQKFCLIPNTRTSGNEKIVYVVASCLRFYEKTIPALVKQLQAEGIPLSAIKVVVNGCDTNYDKNINGVDYAFSTHDAWEWSAIYEAPLRWKFDYAMVIHDTNHIYPGFKRRVESFNRYMPWDYLPATPFARCLLGLYSYDFLLRTNDWLKSIDGISKTDGIVAEVAGELLHQANTVLAIGDPEMNGAARQADGRDVGDFFNSGSMRQRRVFTTLNLHKFTQTSLDRAQAL